MKKNLLIMKRNLIQTLLELFFPVLLFLIIIGLRQIFNRDNHLFEELEGTFDNFMVNKTILSSVGFNKVVVKSYLDPTLSLNFYNLFDIKKYTKDDISNLNLSQIDLTELIDNDKIEEFKNDLYNNYTLAQYYLSYLEMPIYINPYYICSQNNSKKELKPKIAFIGDVPDKIKYKMIKDSIIYNRFTPIKYELNENSFIEFKTIKDMEDIIKGKNYKNKKDELICFGLKFLYDKSSNNFDYSLHFFDFERIGRGDSSDIPSCKYGMFDKYQSGPDLQSYLIYTNGGYNYVMKLVNEYILKNQTNKKYSSLSYAVTPMKYIDFRVDPFGQLFGNITVICILIAYIFPLNIYVYKIVKENETRIREGMKIMGLGDSEYFLSYFIQYIVISIFVTSINAFIYQLVLTTIPYYYLYGLIFLFSLDVFALVYFCQSFIDKRRISIVLTFIIYAILYCLTLSCLFESSGDFYFKLFMALIPAVNLTLSVDLLFKFDYHFKKFYDRDFTIKHYRYSLSWAYVMFVVDFFLFIFLGYYLSNVLPHDYGIRKPWYFLFSCNYWSKKGKKKYYSKKNKKEFEEYQTEESKTLDEESFSYLKENKNIKNRHNIDLNNSKFESEDIYEDKDENEILEIRNIVKIFDDGKKAVNGVNLNFYRDEIFALLGHNGAGKTTLLSILTGMYEATKGKAIYEGNNILDSNNIDIFRQKVGICPQHDTLFEELTIREHLEMFSIIKGVSKNKVNSEVSKVLHDFQIEDIQNMLAANLSAGERRKLSIAISLIGGSEVIFLDEPSSGMDITSRRNLWEILKKIIEKKIIILTTHYMEEASVLGNRIGIMAEGVLKCIGTPLFLIEKYGKYLSVNIYKEKDANNDQIIDFFKSRAEGIETEILTQEILIRIPKNKPNSEEKNIDIKTFFEDLDNNVQPLRIKNYSAAMPTLEDVFLNIGSVRLEEEEMLASGKIDEEKNEQILFNQKYIKDFTRSEKFFIDAAALLKKRIYQVYRDKKTLVLEFLCPILLVLVGCLVVQVDIFEDSEPVVCNLETLAKFGDQVIYYGALDNNDSYYSGEDNLEFTSTNVTTEFLENDQAYYNSTLGLQHFIEILYQKEQQGINNFGALYALKTDYVNHQYNWILISNGRARQSPMMYSYLFLSQILQKEGIDFEYTHYPLPTTNDNQKNSKALNNFCLVFFVSIAFDLIPANFVSSIVAERINNSKHLMRISGVSIVAYWFINFIFELAKYYISAGVCLLILWAFDFIPNYFYILYLLYGPSMVMCTYFLSTFFDTEAMAQNFLILFNLVFGALGSTVVIMLRAIDESTKGAKVGAFFIRIIPSFAFGYGYNLLLNGQLILFIDYSIEYLTKPDSIYIDPEYAGSDALFLGLSFVVYTVLIIIIECNSYKVNEVDDNLLDPDFRNNIEDQEVVKEIIKANDKKSLHMNQNNESNFPMIETSNQDGILQVDSMNGDHPISQSNYKNINKNDYSVRIKNMQKIYNNDSCCSVPTMGVKNISFTVDYGECFGLLGLNGAGKTTIFKAITEEHSPTHGSIWINGLNIVQNFDEVKLMFGYCPQFDAIFLYMTVYENLEFYSRIKGVAPEKLNEVVTAMIESMTLTKYTNKVAGRLSGGNKRKLSVAISMICNPPIVLLDEPSTGMDPEARRFMWAVIHKLTSKSDSNSVIMTTHAMDEAETLCKRIGIMVNGEFVCLGTCNYIKETYGYGYDLDIRIKPMEQNELYGMIKSLNLKRSYKVRTLDEVHTILATIGKEHYFKYITEDGIGRKIYHEVTVNGDINIQALINWTRYLKCAMKMIRVVLDYFNEVVLAEFIENNFLFKLKKNPDSKSIGFLFSLLEKEKDECEITEYSIQQTSLEQIFNKFAENQGKTEEDIRNEVKKDTNIPINLELVNDLIR